MRSLKRTIGVGVLLVLSSVAVRAQNSDLIIEKQFFINPRVLFLSDFNITQSGSTQPLFRVTLRNRGASTKLVVLLFRLISRSHPNDPIVEAKTRPFPLSPTEPISITNLDITQNRLPDIKLEFFRYNRKVAKKLQDAILRSGRLPTDTYDIVIRLQEFSNPSNSEQVVETISVLNPTRLDLLRPGNHADRGRCREVFSTQPQFQWLSNADRFEFTVCEALPTNSSPEDVMQNEPRARLYLERGKDFIGTPSVVYPSTGVWPLEPGKTYYWQVVAEIETVNGVLRIPSEIYCFRVAKLEDVNQQIIDRSVRNALRRLLAGTRYRRVLAPNGPLSDYLATGRISLNGRKLDVSDLNTLILRFTTRKAEIKNVSIE